ncbi:membrane-associated tyrosine- and threonine-specific cdc2-inhibitory kinase-like [Acropora palmata]|uniref:membrane-associated tyrosine- and threonine-specific cdc2-inhibitory kinase-like n=1 Tax=Acropora palmata TaxID=6131 RepID=UPI003DA0F14F
MEGTLKSPRPIPNIVYEATFSHRKPKKNQQKKLLEDDCLPPRAPVKSAPPISRVFKHTRKNSVGALQVSFRDNSSKLKSPHYNEKSKDLYFEQCFEVTNRLGAGSFGEVFKVRSKEDGCLYAVKKSRDKFRGDADRRYKLEEVNKHELLKNHRNCVKFVKAWEERQHLYIQTELCEMSLKDYLEKTDSTSESVVWEFLIDLTLGLKHLHDNNMVHMDIKPANLFIGLDGLCKIGDFGLVLELSKCDTTQALEGDPKYLAPELMQGSFTKCADIFSLGITLLELASDLDLPRGGDTWHQLRNGQLPQVFTQGFSADLKRLISWMMAPLPQKRPTVDEILAEPAVQQAWKRRQRVYLSNWMNQSLSSVYSSICAILVWLWTIILWPFRPLEGFWLPASNVSKLNSEDMSFHDDTSFSSDETCNNYSLYESSSTPNNCSISFEEMLTKSIPKPPWHGEGYCSSPIHLTPCSHMDQIKISPCIYREQAGITPPFHTSSPEHQRYTPPSDRGRSRLFDDGGFLSRSNVGPRNLLEVFEDAANTPEW